MVAEAEAQGLVFTSMSEFVRGVGAEEAAPKRVMPEEVAAQGTSSVVKQEVCRYQQRRLGWSSPFQSVFSVYFVFVPLIPDGLFVPLIFFSLSARYNRLQRSAGS